MLNREEGKVLLLWCSYDSFQDSSGFSSVADDLLLRSLVSYQSCWIGCYYSEYNERKKSGSWFIGLPLFPGISHETLFVHVLLGPGIIPKKVNRYAILHPPCIPLMKATVLESGQEMRYREVKRIGNTSPLSPLFVVQSPLFIHCWSIPLKSRFHLSISEKRARTKA